MDLEFKAKFSEIGLIRDILPQIQDRFPQLSIEESLRLAQESLRKITSEGDSALYMAVVKLGLDYAINDYQKSK